MNLPDPDTYLNRYVQHMRDAMTKPDTLDAIAREIEYKGSELAKACKDCATHTDEASLALLEVLPSIASYLTATAAKLTALSNQGEGDRDALNYLMTAFDSEFHSCERCGHEEPTKDYDSAIFLREYLADARLFLTPSEADRRDAERLDWLDAHYESYGFEDQHEGNRWLLEGPFRTAREAIDAATQEQT